MERICTNCRAVIAAETKADWCPACGGAIVERKEIEAVDARNVSQEIDHRGIVLPRRSAVGGIITPQ